MDGCCEHASGTAAHSQGRSRLSRSGFFDQMRDGSGRGDAHMQHGTNAALPSANRVQVRPSRLLIVVAAQCVASSASFETMRGCPEGWPREVGPNGGQLCRKKDRESMEWICADCWKQLAGEPWCAPSGTCSASPPSAATLDNLLMLREPTSLPSLPMFWHIPKAAGTAMEALLVFLYNKTILIHEQASPTEATWKRVKAGGKVAGEDSPWVVHEPTEITAAEVAAAAEQSGGAKLAIMTDLPFINLPLLKTVRCRLFAVFRQPVTRVVSLFNYLQTATWEPTYGKIPSKFEAYIESSTFESRWLTTALALPPEKWAMADALGSKRLLAEAKRTLSRFCLVGLFDRLPESLTRFETYFNLPHTGSPGLRARFTTGDGAWNQAAKAADNRTRLVEGTPLWTKVEGKLQSDVAVYKHAARLFEQQAGLVAPGAGEGAPTPKTAPETRLTAGSKRGGGRRCILPRRAAEARVAAPCSGDARRLARRLVARRDHCRSGGYVGEALGVYSYLPGCQGTSPTGIHWTYVQPQHTGTGTVLRYLYTKGIVTNATCQHHHTALPSPGVTHAFAFVTNPYKRVVSNAGFWKILQAPTEAFPDKDPICRFRAWLHAQDCPPVLPQTALLACHPVKFIGHTSSLAADLRTALLGVGYPAGVGGGRVPQEIEFGTGKDQRHCITSCSSNKTDAPSLADWYDHASLKKVQSWYQSDFEAYHFSLDPAIEHHQAS